MVRYRRNLVPGGTYFFTAALADRASRDLVEHIDALRASFRRTRAERPFTIDAIVVLPDHLHAILTLPTGDADYSARWGRIKGLFAREVAKRAFLERNERGEYGIWQRRFWEHTLRDDGDFARHVDYIHFNPVKHGLRSRVSDWPYSSFHRYVRMGILPMDWGGSVKLPEVECGEPPSHPP